MPQRIMDKPEFRNFISLYHFLVLIFICLYPLFYSCFYFLFSFFFVTLHVSEFDSCISLFLQEQAKLAWGEEDLPCISLTAGASAMHKLR